MVRADLLLNLVKAANVGDRALFNKALEELIADERSKQNNVLADSLAAYLDGGEPLNAIKALVGEDRDTPCNVLSDRLTAYASVRRDIDERVKRWERQLAAWPAAEPEQTKDKTPKDWELHHARLWAHPGNARFAQPTKRVLDAPPPIQAFPPRDVGASAGDIVVAIAIVVALVAAIVIW